MVDHLRVERLVAGPVLLNIERLRKVSERGRSFHDHKVINDLVQFSHADFQPIQLAVHDKKVIDLTPSIAIGIRLPTMSLTVMLRFLHWQETMQV